MARMQRNLWLLPLFVLCLALSFTGARAQSDETFGIPGGEYGRH